MLTEDAFHRVGCVPRATRFRRRHVDHRLFLQVHRTTTYTREIEKVIDKTRQIADLAFANFTVLSGLRGIITDYSHQFQRSRCQLADCTANERASPEIRLCPLRRRALALRTAATRHWRTATPSSFIKRMNVLQNLGFHLPVLSSEFHALLPPNVVFLHERYIVSHVLHAMDDVKDFAFRGNHRCVDGIPIPDFKALTVLLGHVIPLDPHGIDRFCRNDTVQRRHKISSGIRFGSVKVVGEDIEDRFAKYLLSPG